MSGTEKLKSQLGPFAEAAAYKALLALRAQASVAVPNCVNLDAINRVIAQVPVPAAPAGTTVPLAEVERFLRLSLKLDADMGDWNAQERIARNVSPHLSTLLRDLIELHGQQTAVLSELEALRKFKAYVHQRLDDAGVDPHAEQNALNGCRIGARLDDVLRATVADEAPNASTLLIWCLRYLDDEGLEYVYDKLQRRCELGHQHAAQLASPEPTRFLPEFSRMKLARAMALTRQVVGNDTADVVHDALSRLTAALDTVLAAAKAWDAPMHEEVYSILRACGLVAPVKVEPREPNNFCEVKGQVCNLGYCDENGCIDRKPNYVDGQGPSEAVAAQ